MTREQKVLLLGTIDEFLIKEMDHDTLFTDEQRASINELYRTSLDELSPRAIRESFITAATKLYAEVFGE